MTTLTTDGVLAVATALDIQTLPTALAVRPAHADAGQFAAAQLAAVSELHDRGVLDRAGDVLDEALTTALFALSRPERQLVARILPGGGTMIRFCLVRRGFDHAVAIRTGDELDVRTVWADEDPMTLARPLLAALGPCPPADIPAFSVPSIDLRERLDDPDTDHADAVYHLGIPQDAAVAFGAALRRRHSTAEIVCYSHCDGLAVRSPAAAAVYDTAVGRIIGGGSVTADGQTWTTLAPGSDHRTAQVIAALIESLPEGRWMP
ncbi:ESX secretion-associated protein EspG [Nocardia alni]|uniref:ESX secretion-associated protein EspG n=1 Tax=Nocardia alni TaxID=2815723 RepID=UPI001C213E10|nr:ESX secretion-associated protein EspG [Nocardia alni]